MDKKVERKYSLLTLGQRQEIKDIFKSNDSLGVKTNNSELARRFNVSETTIRRLRLMSKSSETATGKKLEISILNKRKKIPSSKYPLLEDILYEWFKNIRVAGQQVSTATIKEKALMINKELNGDSEFKASNGWFCRFRERFQIRLCSLHEEKLSDDFDSSIEFVDTLASIMRLQNFQLHQIYNADETGLLWKMLPTRTFISHFEKNASGSKLSEERVTVMVCANADGSHKIPLYIIGKLKNSRCFSGFNQLPVTYAEQKNAWMTGELFLDWLTTVFLPSVREFQAQKSDNPHKVLLIVDNAKCHLSKEEIESIDDMCVVEFLPPNVTSLFQPMDQGVIEQMKILYRKSLLREMLLQKDELSLFESLKQRNMKTCCVQIASAWAEITSTNICRSWRKLIPTCDIDIRKCTDVTVDDIIQILYRLPGFQQITHDEVSVWLQVDRSEPGWNVLNINQIIRSIQNHEINEETYADNEHEQGEDIEHVENIEKEEFITDNIKTDATTAYNAFQLFRNWFEQRRECDSQKMIQLQKLNEITTDITASLNELLISENS